MFFVLPFLFSAGVPDVLNCPESDGSSYLNVAENSVLRNINIDNKFMG
ncbi:MAG: hypothetical protein LBG48_01095 [Rickettsiales bacterium]|nr:hypothetical protein [Rickettsiales bacterium]